MTELGDKFKSTRLVNEYLGMISNEQLGELVKSFWEDMPNKTYFTPKQKEAFRFSVLSLYVHSCKGDNLGKYPSPFLPREGA